jgi:hypothetical protein
VIAYYRSGNAEGGGLAEMGGPVTLRSDTVTDNIVKGGSASKPKYNGNALGGGPYIDPRRCRVPRPLHLGSHENNKPGDIYRPYILIA